MRSITEEKFASEFLIYKELTPQRPYKTYLAMKERSDGSLFAVILKEMNEKAAEIYQNLTLMWNPYIANTYEILSVTSQDGQTVSRYVAVTEYVYATGCPNEESLSLAQFVRKNGCLNEKTALTICTQICKGLEEFHKQGFVHRDLKPDNIMISKYDEENPQIKIIDFGGAKSVDLQKISDTTVVGTLGYQAPESLSLNTTNRADIYSIGCILNFMLTGQEPGIVHYKKNHYIASIIEKATNEDPSHRYDSVAVLSRNLEHELRTTFFDKIPILRSMPGFRTHTLWKETFAGISYATMIFVAVICIDKFGLVGLAEIFIFYIIVPLIIIFNMGNLLRFFPDRLRKNNRSFLMLRTVIILLSLFAPIVADNILGRI